MKFTSAALILAVAQTSQAFTFVPANSRAASSLAAVATPTRFDTMKAKYKGYVPKIDTSDAIFGYDAFEEAVAQVDYAFNRNDVVKGTIVQYDNGGAVVDIGAKSSAFLPLQEAGLTSYGKEIDEVVSLDSDVEVMIISDEDENGQLLVSIKRIEYAAAWDKVKAMNTEDALFEAEVVAVNRGGAIVLVEGLRAFLPGSHLTGTIASEELIGDKLPLKFLEVNPDNNKLVVSNRRAIVETQMNDLSRGDVVDGIIKALKPYGAFVEVGGMSGLLHISQISYDRIDNLEKVFQPGDKVKCMIIDHDKLNGRIALSTKTLEPEPGDMLKDSARVFEMAEETAAKYHERMEADRKAREEAAKDIVLGLGDVVGDALAVDGEEAVGDDLDSVLS
jgi:small subunit ribosomal protein S1